MTVRKVADKTTATKLLAKGRTNFIKAFMNKTGTLFRGISCSKANGTNGFDFPKESEVIIMKSLSKKHVLVIVATSLILLAVAIAAFTMRRDGAPEQTESKINIVGTWYSDKPDSVIFDKDGNFKFSAWNGGNPWLTFPGIYTVDAEVVTLQNSLDGVTTLTINQAEDGSYTLTGKYTYYQTEEAAKAALAEAAAQAAEEEANIIPNTVNNLLGEWTSLNGMTVCTFTETGITVHNAATEFVPEETLYYEYEILSAYMMKVVKNGAAANFRYEFTESSDGVITLYCPAIGYATTFTKGTLSDEERAERYKSVYGCYPDDYTPQTDENTGTSTTDHVKSSEKNPRVTA